MNELTKLIVENIVSEIHSTDKHFIGIFSGRFQPFAKQHKYVYDFMKSLFPDCYIVSSNKVDKIKSPLTFEEKKKVMIASGIEANRIKPIVQTYKVKLNNKFVGGWEDILKKYDEKNTVLVFFVGEKDKLRFNLNTGTIKLYSDTTTFYGYNKHIYIYVIPNLTVDGKVASATQIRNAIRSEKLTLEEKKEFFDETMATKNNNIFNMLVNKFNGMEQLNEEKQLLTCGGAFGHMAHIFDDTELTFADLKQIIIKSLNGQLSNEVIEKVDGQNLMISWKDGKLIFARNKGHLKNFGQDALTVEDIKSKFAGRGDLSNAFSFAANDLNGAITALTDAQRFKVFQEGKRFMNLEVLWPETTNIIPYNMRLIIFHNFREYDISGNVVGGDFHESARMLAGMIRQVNKDIQSNFKISTLAPITLPTVKDFQAKKDIFLDQLSKVQRKYNCSDGDKLEKYVTYEWIKLLKNKAKELNYTMPAPILKDLIKRFVSNDKSKNLRVLKQEISNSEFTIWLLKFIAEDELNFRKTINEPIMNIFLKLSVEVLTNISTFLAPNRKQVVQNIKNQIDNIKNEIIQSNDVNKLEKLEVELEKIQQLGGFDTLIPSEGIVFSYTPIGKTEPKLYKYTGSFGPVNQILGMLKYARA